VRRPPGIESIAVPALRERPELRERENGARLVVRAEHVLLVPEEPHLVALDREEYDSSALLFELLNETDGMREDLDIIFLLTTNRADRVEPAVAARPGRVDLAAELPLPDAEGRRRLIDLYGAGLRLEARDLPAVVARTEGASPAFIRELLRRAALTGYGSADARAQRSPTS
jgi:cell division protease FtsH